MASDHTIDDIFVTDTTFDLSDHFAEADEDTYRFSSHSAWLNRMNNGSVKLSAPTQELTQVREQYTSTTPAGSSASMTPQIVIDFAEERAAMVARVSADFKQYGRFEDELFYQEDATWWETYGPRIGSVHLASIRWNYLGQQNAVPVIGATDGYDEKSMQVRVRLDFVKTEASASDADADIIIMGRELSVIMRNTDSTSGSYIAGMENAGPVLFTPVTDN